MGAGQNKAGTFKKVGEGPYRCASDRIHHARILINYKEVRRSPDTTDRATAKRKLANLHRKPPRTSTGHARVTLAGLCDRYLVTVQNQQPKTLATKHRVAARVKRDFPGGADIPASKVLPSQG